ncbi:MAG: hypothetical protein COV66_04960 [Nitrospinae bacterium CG11_big_fil_rev_8_21_14_0_20_45_15]|nr:MAG: hypothetical protein COV66_04960 [Nitrospinae bacterium CG11_big_fil_rev_8_21_14_0_20_45_15]
MDTQSVTSEMISTSTRHSTTSQSVKKPSSQLSSPVEAIPDKDSVTVSLAGKQALANGVTGTGNNPADATASASQRKLSVTEDNRVVLKIVDGQTQKVVRQIPDEEIVRLRDAVQRSLENL